MITALIVLAGLASFVAHVKLGTPSPYGMSRGG
jgi:hypothetical protein